MAETDVPRRRFWGLQGRTWLFAAVLILGSLTGLVYFSGHLLAHTAALAWLSWSGCGLNWQKDDRSWSLTVSKEISAGAAGQIRNVRKLTAVGIYRCQAHPAIADALRDSPSLRLLIMQDAEVPLDFLRRLGSPPQLDTIHIWKSKLSDDDIVSLAQFPALYHVDFRETGLTEASINSLLANPQLATLQLVGNPVTLESLHVNNEREGFCLNVSLTQVTDRGVQNLERLPGLKSLSLEKTKITAAAGRTLAKLKALEYLVVSKNPLGDEFVTAIAEAPQITELDLDECQITGATLLDLNRLKSLETLSLSYNPLTEEFLPKLAQLKNLRSLCLIGCSVNTDFLRELAGHPGLGSLSLEGCPVTDDGLRALQSSALNSLNVTGTQVTEAGLEEFRQVQPNCDVFSD